MAEIVPPPPPLPPQAQGGRRRLTALPVDPTPPLGPCSPSSASASVPLPPPPFLPPPPSRVAIVGRSEASSGLMARAQTSATLNLPLPLGVTRGAVVGCAETLLQRILSQCNTPNHFGEIETPFLKDASVPVVHLLFELVVMCRPDDIPRIWPLVFSWCCAEVASDVVPRATEAVSLLISVFPLVTPQLPEDHLEALRTLLGERSLPFIDLGCLPALLRNAGFREKGSAQVRFTHSLVDSVLKAQLAEAMGPKEILMAVETLGAERALEVLWPRVEVLQTAGRFDVEDISALYACCSGQWPGASSEAAAMALSIHRRNAGRDGLQPLATRMNQLFSETICESIPTLKPEQISTFVVALTSRLMPMDEFWLFMMAKRIQDTSEAFSAAQITQIARCYADRNLEDDQFFTALAARVVAGLSEFTLPQLADFLLSCAKLRFHQDELSNVVLSLFEDPGALVGIANGPERGIALGAAITAAALLDERSFNYRECCKHLVAHPEQLRLAVADIELAKGLALATVCAHDHVGVRILVPSLLKYINAEFSSRQRSVAGGSRLQQLDMGTVYRRVTVMGLCAVLGVPDGQVWPLRALRDIELSLMRLEDRHDRINRARKREAARYEPASSSFHLEVVAVLRLLEVEHTLEQRQHPFMLDVGISSAQLDKAKLAWATKEKSILVDLQTLWATPIGSIAPLQSGLRQ